VSITLIPTPESSQIEAIGYAPAYHTLAVQFKSSGAVYHYFAVPIEIWDGFQAAESKGKYFGKVIKGYYEYQRQEGA
jgi:lysyl-tRNA synthetase, class II